MTPNVGGCGRAVKIYRRRDSAGTEATAWPPATGWLRVKRDGTIGKHDVDGAARAADECR